MNRATAASVSWLPSRVFVVAEAGVNHNGDVELARQLIDGAAAAHADAVKFQTFRADAMVTPDAPKATYQKLTTGGVESQYEMLRSLELPREALAELKARAHDRGILFFSTPFEEGSADLLDSLGVPLFKIPSGEMINLPFLAHVARKGKPIILSTGMSTLGEVETAVHVLQTEGVRHLALLHCVSSYPTQPEDVNLRAMDTLAAAFGLPVGFSDHTPGVEIAMAAAARGARIIEKHFTLDRSLAGPDHAASVMPGELTALVKGVRNIEAALGDGQKRPRPCESDVAAAARKSLVAARDLAAGTVLGADSIAIKRPGTGLPPALLPQVQGRRLRVDVKAGTLLQLGMLTVVGEPAHPLWREKSG